jgi:YbbR domain-containing protein
MKTRLNIQNFLISSIFQNIPTKLLAVGGAIAVWAWVQSEQVVTRRVRVQVNYIWPASLVWSEEPPTRLVVTLEGPQSVLLPLDQQQLNMDVNLTEGASEGNNEVDFTIQTLNGLPQSLGIKQISPPGTDIWLEEPRAKEVPVRLSLINQPPRGYELKGYTLEPQDVIVSGPKSQIQNISEAPTDVIDLSNYQEDTTIDVRLIRGTTVKSLLDGPIRVTLDIEESILDRTFTDVPITSRASGWELLTESVTITLRGPVRVLETLKHDDLSLEAIVPESVPPEQDQQEIRYTGSTPMQDLVFTGFDTETISIAGLEPSMIVLQRVTLEE